MILTSFYVAGLALALVLLVALHRRLSGLPPVVWSMVRKEREAEAPKALDAMKEAVAAKAGAAVVVLRGVGFYALARLVLGGTQPVFLTTGTSLLAVAVNGAACWAQGRFPCLRRWSHLRGARPCR
jgi:hypothetical protein